MSHEDKLRNALQVASTFPKTLIDQEIYSHVAYRYVDLIQKESERIFGPENRMQLELWDLMVGSVGFVSKVIKQNKEKLRIGSDSLTNEDPLCRFMFVHAPHSKEKLFVTQEVLLYAFTYHQVMAAFLDFIVPFGKQSDPRDFHFSELRCEVRLSAASPGLYLNDLGRSGKDFRMCYNLKSVEYSAYQSNWPWSIRQAAIYHSFDINEGRTFWTVVKGDELIKNRIKEATNQVANGRCGIPSSTSTLFAESLLVHLIIFDWCAESWRWYLNFLEGAQAWTKAALLVRFDKPVTPRQPRIKVPPPEKGPVMRTLSDISRRVMSATGTLIPPNTSEVSFDAREPQTGFEPDLDNHQSFTFDHLQKLNDHEEKVNIVIQVIKSNIRILGNIRNRYIAIVRSAEFPSLVRDNNAEQFKTFEEKVLNHVSDLEIQLERAKNISSTLANRKGLLNGILEYRNMEANKLFTSEAAKSTRKMETMTEEMTSVAKKTKEQAVSMHVITFVTLLFLPGTFMSTIMSTDIIKFPKNDRLNTFERNFSLDALKLYITITIPLMAVTISGWFCTYWCVNNRQAARDARRKKLARGDNAA